ncbi:MAG: hypothetical protein CUN52_08560 [Phototrophicales bacterium]|nr:MAG: hypothetical protein CUN52_08560 [Phototrophicales bacterium]
MTQLPKLPLDLSQILQKVLSLVGLAKAPETDNRIQEMRIVDGDNENHYFTFTKEGELIDIDDDMMMALEQQIRADYIKSFTESTSN